MSGPEGTWLTHEQIDEITEGISARDLIDAQGEGRTDLQVASLLLIMLLLVWASAMALLLLNISAWPISPIWLNALVR